MSLVIGSQLGAYKILAPLGKGGMGEVYRAKDTRLDREVAVKVLPAEFAQEADRLQRFEQEARATSALNHPNILTVHDFGTASPELGGAPYLVAELLDGEELREQLNRSALPGRKAIEYALQIVAGLTAAHDKGVIHRDLKPENLFITKDERIKILDFGLAKVEPLRTVSASSEVATLKQITTPGTVMGTVAYMSPEQVRGDVVDARSDIFAFGQILYEMLTGKRAFDGTSIPDLMSAILKDEPPELPGANPQMEKLVRRCLEKKPERRFQTASDLGFALEALSTTGYAGVPLASNESANRAAAGKRTASPTRWRERIAWLGLGLVSLLAIALGVAYFRRPALEAKAVRLLVNPPDKATRFDWPTISPDGRTLAFIATVEGKMQLWVRPLNSTIAKPLLGTEGADSPFWSPDNQFLAYFASNKLKKVALTGGAPIVLGDAPVRTRGTWNQEGVILLGGATGIRRISAEGGAVSHVSIVDSSRGETGRYAPCFLPDGQHFLFVSSYTDPAKRGIYVASLSGGDAKLLLPTDNRSFGLTINPVRQHEGYLIFSRQGELLAQPFDLSRQQIVGNLVRLAEQVQIPGDAYARFSLSVTGELVMIEGHANQQLTWFDRTGKKLNTLGAGSYFTPRLSPDGQRLMVPRRDPQMQTHDLRLFDLTRGTDMRFTFDPATDSFPIWSPDGSRLVWASSRETVLDLYQKSSNGAGQDELLWKSAYLKNPMDWSADGKFILFRESTPQTSFDLWVLPMAGERKPWPWLNTPADERSAAFSPDGKWIAYQSDEAGRSEIYIQAFAPGAPASGGKWQVSTNGGAQPHWRRDGQELYYLSADGTLMGVEMTPGAEIKAGTPKPLFSVNNIGGEIGSGYTQTGDGQQFLFVTNAEETSLPPFTVVLNWMAELKR